MQLNAKIAEEWHPVFINGRSDIDGLYSVSSYGRLRSNENRRNLGSGLICKLNLTGKGYSCAALCANGKPMTVMIHRLVAKAFISNPENKPQVNHKNGIKTDNRVENLEWATGSENNKHAYDFLGRKARHGINHNRAKLKESDVKEIRAWWKTGDVTQASLARRYGIHATGIGQICLGRAWKHIA